MNDKKLALGGISGFLFGLFIGFDLTIFGVFPFKGPALFVCSILGLVAGLALAWFAPLSSASAEPDPDLAVGKPEA